DVRCERSKSSSAQENQGGKRPPRAGRPDRRVTGTLWLAGITTKPASREQRSRFGGTELRSHRIRGQVLEVPCDGPPLIAGRLVQPASSTVPRVAAGLHHDHPHAGAAYARMGAVHQRTAHPVALMLRIDDDHIDLPHRVLWVDPGADPT